MKQNNDKQAVLARLALEIEQGLLADSDCRDQVNGELNSSLNSGGLSPAEIDELEEVRQALQFLNQAKRAKQQIDVHADTHPADFGETLFGDGQPEARTTDSETDSSGTLRTVGRYEIIKPIGEGGFARVFLARDPTLDRLVALKVPKPGRLLSEEARSRFQREARSAAMLSHPAIVPVFETGNEGPVSWIASEYCPGSTLGQWIRDRNDGDIDIRLAAAIVARMAEAVQHAHARNVIHRDLKPDNVLVRDGQGCVSERIHITDFGLARNLETDDATLTIDGAILGTPAYMSPEQARGDRELTNRSDIFSLGIILYELLTGQRPFLKTGHIATLMAIESGMPPLPQSVNRMVPRDLQAVCLKCLNKRPQDRYATAFDLSEDLQHWLKGEPVDARMPGLGERAGKWCRRNPLPTFAFGLTILALCVALFQWKNASNNYQHAQTESQRANRNIRFAQQTVKEMVGSIANSSSIPIALRQTMVQRAIDLQNRLLTEDPENREVRFETAMSYLAMSVLLDEQRKTDVALEMVEHASELLDGIPLESCTPTEREEIHRVTAARADYLLSLGRTEEALQLLDADNGQEGVSNGAHNRLVRARALRMENRLDEAWLELQRAKVTLESLEESVFVGGYLAVTYYEIGLLEWRLGNPAEAESYLREAIEVQQMVNAQSPVHESMEENLAKAHYAMAEVQLDLANYSAAVQSMIRAQEFYDFLAGFNPRVPRYAFRRVESRLMHIEHLLEQEDFPAAARLLEEIDTRFKTLPEPAADDSANTARFNEQKRTVVGSILHSHLQLAEHRIPGDSASQQGVLHLEQATQYFQFLQTHFPEAEEIIGFAERIEALSDSLAP